jgi:RHS repeat-associated protein
VKKYVPSTGETTLFVYDAAGKQIAEYSTIVETTNAKVEYLTNDHLGSPRVNTDANGAVTARHDYHPFGEEIATSQRTNGLAYAGDTVRKQFTSKERDSETGLDYFEARYYSSALGRFVNPDEFSGGPDELFDFVEDASENPTFYADVENPQSLNKYQYAFNSPLRYIDPDGHDVECPTCATPIPWRVPLAPVIAPIIAPIV